MVSVLKPQVEPGASIEYRPEETLTSRTQQLVTPMVATPQRLAQEKEGQRQLEITRQIQQEQAQGDSTPVPTLEDILQGKSTQIGDTDVDLFLVNRAKTGDKEAVTKIQNQIDIATGNQYFSNMREAKTPVIAGLDITPTGMEIDNEVFKNLSEKDRKTQRKIRDNRQEFFTDYLIKEIPNPYVQQILLDTFSTSQLADETERSLKELYGSDLPMFVSDVASLVRNIPSVLAATFEFADSDEEGFSDSWEKTRPKREANWASVQRVMDRVDGYTSLAKNLNSRFESEFIKRHGQDAYDQMFPVVETEDGKLRTPIITEEGAKKLLQYSFEGLPTLEKALVYAITDAPLSVGFTASGIASGTKKLKRISDYIDRQPVSDAEKARMRLADPSIMFRHIQKTEASNIATRSYFSFLDRVATRFGLRGNEGVVTDIRKNQEAVETLRTQILKTQDEISANRFLGGDPKRISKLEADLKIMEAEHARAFLRGGLIGSPLITSFAIDEGLIAAGQALGQDLGPSLGLSPETGQFIGAFGLAIGGRPVLSGTKFATLKTADAISLGVGSDVIKMFEDVVSYTSGGKIPLGTLIDRKYDIINTARVAEGLDPLSQSQIQSIDKIAKIMRFVPEDQRETVLGNITEAVEVRDNLVGAFNPEQQTEVLEKLQLTFAQMSQINYLQAIETNNLATGRGSLDKILPAIRYQQSQENLLDGVNMSINRLRELLVEGGGQDVDKLDNMRTWLDNLEKAAMNQTREIAGRRDEVSRLLDTKVADPDVALSPDEFDKIIDARIGLDKTALNDIEKQKQIINNEYNSLSGKIERKIREIQALQGTDVPTYRKQLGLLLEAAYGTQMAYHQRLAKAAYAEVDTMMKGKELDIQDIIKETFGVKEGIDSQSLRGLFQADREFFRSTSGRQLLQTFEGMANRFFSEFDEQELQKIKAQFTIKNFEDGTPNPLAADMPEDPSFFEIGLAM